LIQDPAESKKLPSNLPSHQKTFRSRSVVIVFAILLLSISYYLFKLPLKYAPIAFYDDGEILYHAFNIHKGGIPYLDDISHHFLGYVFPIYLWGNIFDFTPYLVRQFALFNQVLVGLGLIFILRQFVSSGWAIISALLYISAREPFVTGFPIQYEINVLFVFILFFAIKFIKEPRSSNLIISYLLSGIAFTFDQRALLLTFIPLFTSVYEYRRRKKLESPFLSIFLSFLAWISMPLLSLLYLWRNGALYSFYEQTILYPSQFRIKSYSLLEILIQGIDLHKYLFITTFEFTWLAIIGYIVVLLDKKIRERIPQYLRVILLILPIPLFLIAAAGTRDYDYYTIVWFPYLAILTGLLTLYIERTSRVMKLSFLIIFLIALVPPYFKSLYLLKEAQFSNPSSDGSIETAEYLNENLTPQDTVFIWGYRLDLLTRIDRLSYLPFTNQIMIHPDRKITGPDRDLHIYKPYEEFFINSLSKDPPNYLINFNRKEYDNLSSRSSEVVKNLILQNYDLKFEIQRKDIFGGEPSFQVYKLRSKLQWGKE